MKRKLLHLTILFSIFFAACLSGGQTITVYGFSIMKEALESEHPVVVVDRNATAAERPVIEAFRNYLWSDEAQKAFVKYHFRSSTDETFNETNPQFARIEQPFTIQLFGGWSRACPKIIEGVFNNQVRR